MQNNEMIKTGVYAGVAALMLAVAYISQPAALRNAEIFDDTRQPFYENIRPEDAKALEIMLFDEKLGTMTPFRVQNKNNRWTIPSHNDYPADAEDRLKKTAGAILSLTKDAIVTNQKDMHAELGVVDPLVTENAAKGWGTRVKLFGEGDKLLADFIFGKDVPGKTGFKYVRIPDKDRVYQVETKNLDLSVRFADWIDTNLLETSSFDMERITLKDYAVDLERRRINDRGTVVLQKDQQTSEWKVDGLSEKEETDKDKARDLASALSDVRIVGVREKPASLSADLQLASDLEVDQMIRRGFYPVEKTLVSDQGETIFTTRDGLQYTLRFGGYFVASRDELTAGKKDEQAKKEEPETKDAKSKDGKDGKSKDDKSKEDKPKDPETQECRFLLVTVAFDESKYPPIPDPVEEPKKDDKPQENKKTEAKDSKAEAKDAEAKKAEEEAKKKAEEEEKKAKAEELKRKREERQKKIDDGKKRAKELSDRYARWYYVIPNDTFKKIRLTRKDLVKEKSADKKDGDAAHGEAPAIVPPAPSTAKPAEEPKTGNSEKAKSETPAAKESPKSDAKPEEKAKSPEKKKGEKPGDALPKAEAKPAEKAKEPGAGNAEKSSENAAETGKQSPPKPAKGGDAKAAEPKKSG